MVLERDLALLHPEEGRQIVVEDLLDLLELDEVGTRSDRTEAQPGQLGDHPGQLAHGPVDAAIRFERQSAALLDPGQLGGVDVPAVHGELGPADGAIAHLRRAQVAPIAGRVRVELADAAVEASDRGLVRARAVESDQGHPAVDGGAGQGGPNRSPGGDRDGRRGLHAVLVVEVRQHHRGGGEVGVADLVGEPCQGVRRRHVLVALQDPRAKTRVGGALVVGVEILRLGPRRGQYLYVQAIASRVSSISARRAPGRRASDSSTAGRRPPSRLATSAMGGCTGPSMVPADRVAAKAQ